MTRDDDFIGQVEGYLDEYEGITPLPGAVRDAIRAELPKTRQIGPLGGLTRDMNIMNKSLQIAIAAAAVLVVAIVGYQLLSGGGVGGPGESSTPQPSAAGSESPSAAPADGRLEPGSAHAILVKLDVPFTATVTVPTAGVWYGDRFVIDNGSADPPGGAGITVWTGQLDVPADPCAWETTLSDPPTGATVDDLVAALAAQLGRDATAPTDITVDGHAGKAIELTVPADADFTQCDNGEYRSWIDSGGGARYHQAPGQHDLLWIVDVDGARVVFDTTFYETTSAADRTGLQAILDSIRIQ